MSIFFNFLYQDEVVIIGASLTLELTGIHEALSTSLNSFNSVKNSILFCTLYFEKLHLSIYLFFILRFALLVNRKANSFYCKSLDIKSTCPRTHFLVAPTSLTRTFTHASSYTRVYFVLMTIPDPILNRANL